MKSPIRPDYRISKKISKPVFDLKDMLVIVEALEEEAIANELIEQKEEDHVSNSLYKTSATTSKENKEEFQSKTRSRLDREYTIRNMLISLDIANVCTISC